MAKSDIKKLANLLVLLGGILGVVWGILALLNMPFTFGLPGIDLSVLGIFTAIILIILSFAVLATSGVVSIPMLKFDNNWVIILILGILVYIFGGGLPGILIIIGAILMVLA
ncbi:MAG: hypothetical protein GF411_11750 [Candidatus Lokiarchaeota archaeon]|nr:hypothetical protein [Candidatus Lokiarchaeota archaeon]